MEFASLSCAVNPQAPDKFTSKWSHSISGWLLCFSSVFFINTARSQKYPVAAIPESLKQHANMVVRLEERYFEVKSTTNIICKERHVYTILNEKGDYYATYRSFYNNNSVLINSISGTMYDAAGKEIRHIKKKEMEDLPAYDGSSFVNDERFKRAQFFSHTYPYTVEFEEEDELHDLIHISNWQPQGSLQCSVEKNIFQISFPASNELRFRMLNAELKPAIETKGDRNTYTWVMNNLPAMEEEPYSIYDVNYTPFLLIGFSDVEMGGYKGNMNTWNDYARFYGSMQKGRDILPEETKQKVHALTDGLKSPEAKIAVLYNYLQQNSHYVGIQLGIGGWQTFDANYVATKKYGDCKALSNFMISLLKESGIKGHAVVIFGGREPMDFVKDFTYDPFNHVICCVPLDKDTVWLECTSQFLSPGYLSHFTANRYGLLIDDDGGQLVHTPVYSLGDNIQSRKISAVLNTEGDLNIEARTSYRALCQDEVEGVLHHYSKEDLASELKTKFSLATYDVISFNYQEDYSHRLPVISEQVQLNARNYAQVSGKRIFINPDILTRSGVKLSENKTRRMPIDLTEEYQYSDSAEISIPAGYIVESQPADLSLKSKYGTYKTKTTITGNQIRYIRVLERLRGRFPASDYTELVQFFNEVSEADHARIVLVKKN